jgi:hypothetical protein
MATSAQLKSSIKQIETAMKNKALKATSLAKFQTQLDRLKGELASLNSPKPKKGVTKAKVLTNLQKLKLTIKADKELKGYKNSGIDIEKDASEPAMKRGVRTSKGLKGNQYGTADENRGRKYYEYRLNRADVKQPPKKYPKLEDGGYMAEGGIINVNGEQLSVREFVKRNKTKSEEQKLSEYDIEQIKQLKEGNSLNFFVGQKMMQVYKVGSNLKMAKGGLAAHGLKSGDVIVDGMLNTAFVYNRDRKLDYSVDLDKGERKEIGDLYHPPHFYKLADGGTTDEELYKVVGKKNGQLVDISELPMTKQDAYKFIEKQGIENHYTNVDVIRYRGNKKRFSDSNYMANGGMVGQSFTITEMKEHLDNMFPYSFQFKVFPIKKGTNNSPDYDNIPASQVIKGLSESDLNGEKLYFPQYKRDHEINFEIHQGGENTYFSFLLATNNMQNYYAGTFGFKDLGDVSSDYITRFLAFLMEQYGLPFKVNHSVMESGGMMAHGGMISEQDAKEKLSKLKDENKLYFSIGNHGQIFMSLKNGFMKSYDNYKQAYDFYLRATSGHMEHGGDMGSVKSSMHRYDK